MRAEVQIKLQLNCALLGIMELAVCVAAREGRKNKAF